MSYLFLHIKLTYFYDSKWQSMKKSWCSSKISNSFLTNYIKNFIEKMLKAMLGESEQRILCHMQIYIKLLTMSEQKMVASFFPPVLKFTFISQPSILKYKNIHNFFIHVNIIDHRCGINHSVFFCIEVI